MSGKGGFTLIEVMLVILIIGVLIGMLLPAISAPVAFSKIRDTEQRITTLSGYIEQYKQTFGDYPPSHAPWTSPGGDPVWSYPLMTPSSYANPDNGFLHPMTINFPLLSTSPWSGPEGGGYLFYFLMGPNQSGWSTTDGNVNAQLVKANWTAPDALTKMISSRPKINGEIDDSYESAYSAAMYYFDDGFGSTGNALVGTIQYAVKQARGGGYDFDAIWGAFESTNPQPITNYSGDVVDSVNRLVGQTSLPYILISAGPDRMFGYVITQRDPTTGADLPRLYSPSQGVGGPSNMGVTDDITNFAHN